MTDEELEKAVKFTSFVQFCLFVWWSIATPWPRHIVIMAWFLELELGLWFSVWRRKA